MSQSILGEELIFRGILLPKMNGVFGKSDVIASGVLFMVYHLHVTWEWPSKFRHSERGQSPSRCVFSVFLRSNSTLRFLPTVERAPTLPAGRKILVAVKAAHYRQLQSFGDMVLADRGLTTEIAQCLLGDLNF